MNAPAFKEWQVITEALGSGEQIIILRKGGIAETRDDFQVEAHRFWLFPTQFHAQRDKTKPTAAKWFSPSTNASSVTLRYFADVAHAKYLDRWEDIARLDPFHFWTKAAIREKFNWSKPPGLHALIVRVHRLHLPVTLPVTPAMGGCKSWIELPTSLELEASSCEPVISHDMFSGRLTCMVERVSTLLG